jgi:hypothetical protein
MTLEKPPRGKPVKRKFIMELEEKYYSRDNKFATAKLISNLATKYSLKVEPTLP